MSPTKRSESNRCAPRAVDLAMLFLFLLIAITLGYMGFSGEDSAHKEAQREAAFAGLGFGLSHLSVLWLMRRSPSHQLVGSAAVITAALGSVLSKSLLRLIEVLGDANADTSFRWDRALAVAFEGAIYALILFFAWRGIPLSSSGGSDARAAKPKAPGSP